MVGGGNNGVPSGQARGMGFQLVQLLVMVASKAAHGPPPSPEKSGQGGRPLGIDVATRAN